MRCPLFERRSSQRSRIAVAVKQLLDRDTISVCQASDIGTHGMFLARPFEGLFERLPKCWLEFSLPASSTVIGTRAQVVRQARHGRYHVQAVRFRQIAPSHRRLIRDYLNAAEPFAAEIPFYAQGRT